MDCSVCGGEDGDEWKRPRDKRTQTFSSGWKTKVN